jgi:hypothetical protein
LLYKNNGNGTFTNVTTQAGLAGLTQLSTVWGDYDDDGDMDLYGSGTGSTGNRLFKNNGDSSKKWLEINLLGVTSNRFGVGAQIEVHAGSLHMMREVNTGVGYRSQNMLTAHFGLGTNVQADSIVVRWPNQQYTRTVRTNVNANQIMTVSEVPILSVQEYGKPTTYVLEQNYPNPFNPTTTIRFSVPSSGLAMLRVFDVLGREVATLVNEIMPEGKHEVSWDARNVSSGLYFYQLQEGMFTETRKMLLLR